MWSEAGVALGVLSLVNFLENYMRTLISVALIPFLNYDSYSYSLLSGNTTYNIHVYCNCNCISSRNCIFYSFANDIMRVFLLWN